MFECKCGGKPMRVNNEILCQKCGKTTGKHVDPEESWSAWKSGKTFKAEEKR